METVLQSAILRYSHCHADPSPSCSPAIPLDASLLASSSLSALAFLLTSAALGVSFDLLSPTAWIAKHWPALFAKPSRLTPSSSAPTAGHPAGSMVESVRSAAAATWRRATGWFSEVSRDPPVEMASVPYDALATASHTAVRDSLPGAQSSPSPAPGSAPGCWPSGGVGGGAPGCLKHASTQHSTAAPHAEAPTSMGGDAPGYEDGDSVGGSGGSHVADSACDPLGVAQPPDEPEPLRLPRTPSEEEQGAPCPALSDHWLPSSQGARDAEPSPVQQVSLLSDPQAAAGRGTGGEGRERPSKVVLEFDYPLYYSYNVTAFCIVLLYAPIAPLTVPAGLAFFLYRLAVDKYNFLFLYRQTARKRHEVEGNGREGDGSVALGRHISDRRLLLTVIHAMRSCLCLSLAGLAAVFMAKGDLTAVQGWLLLFLCVLISVVCLVRGLAAREQVPLRATLPQILDVESTIAPYEAAASFWLDLNF